MDAIVWGRKREWKGKGGIVGVGGVPIFIVAANIQTGFKAQMRRAATRGGLLKLW